MKKAYLNFSNSLSYNSYKLCLSKYLSQYFKNGLNLQIKTLYHLVTPSPWPFVMSLAAFTLMNGSVMYFHSVYHGQFVMFLGLFLVMSTMIIWWSDVIREATFGGYHTKAVQKGLSYGMMLFIMSEIMFFFAFFWAFFHSSLAPSIEMGSIWPPQGIHTFNPWEVPLLNTMILLTSGATMTWAHHAMTTGLSNEAIYGLIATIFLAMIFTALQIFEYNEASFTIADGIYGSTFFMATGFHGFHVLIGTIFLIVCLFSVMNKHFTLTHHFGFEAAAWYWHFVDVVWLFLYMTIYLWGTL